MCSGRVDLSFVIKAFLNGNDAVYIAACKLDECNYITSGNYHALKMVILCKRIMEHIGLNPNRLKINFMSASEGNKFAETVDSFIKEIKDIGPFGKGEGVDEALLKDKVKEIYKLIPYIKIAMREKLHAPISRNREEWDKIFTIQDVETLFREVPSYWIDPEKCQACGTCLRRCPEDAIIGGKNLVHIIDQQKCIKCGTCFEACPPKFGAVTKLLGTTVPAVISEEKRVINRKSKDTKD